MPHTAAFLYFTFCSLFPSEFPTEADVEDFTVAVEDEEEEVENEDDAVEDRDYYYDNYKDEDEYNDETPTEVINGRTMSDKEIITDVKGKVQTGG